MLTVEVGYIPFNFSDEESSAAFEFAKTAKDHLDPEEKRNIIIRFMDTIKKEDKES